MRSQRLLTSRRGGYFLSGIRPNCGLQLRRAIRKVALSGNEVFPAFLLFLLRFRCHSISRAFLAAGCAGYEASSSLSLFTLIYRYTEESSNAQFSLSRRGTYTVVANMKCRTGDRWAAEHDTHRWCHLATSSGGVQQRLLAFRTRTARAAGRRHQYGIALRRSSRPRSNSYWRPLYISVLFFSSPHLLRASANVSSERSSTLANTLIHSFPQPEHHAITSRSRPSPSRDSLHDATPTSRNAHSR